MSKRLTKEYIENFVKENSKCELIEIIRNGKLFLKLKCGEDGCSNIFIQSFFNFSNPNGCKACPACTNKVRRETWSRTRAKQNNLLDNCPEITDIWSSKNSCGPENYSLRSNQKAFFKCNKYGNGS